MALTEIYVDPSIAGDSGTGTIGDRFWSKVATCDSSKCWPWLAAVTDRGYGRFKLNGKTHRAHRISLRLSGLDVPDDMVVCHHCDNPSCVNPNHLFISDALGNQADCTAKGRGRTGERNGQSKLRAVDVIKIRKLLPTKNEHKIAEMFGVSISAIQKIKHRRTWRSI